MNYFFKGNSSLDEPKKVVCFQEDGQKRKTVPIYPFLRLQNVSLLKRVLKNEVNMIKIDFLIMVGRRDSRHSESCSSRNLMKDRANHLYYVSSKKY